MISPDSSPDLARLISGIERAIYDLESSIKRQMLQRDALAALLPRRGQGKKVALPTLEDLRRGKK